MVKFYAAYHVPNAIQSILCTLIHSKLIIILCGRFCLTSLNLITKQILILLIEL